MKRKPVETRPPFVSVFTTGARPYTHPCTYTMPVYTVPVYTVPVYRCLHLHTHSASVYVPQYSHWAWM